MNEYRTGNHWGVTIVREPAADATEPCTNDGDHPSHAKCAQLVAVVVNGDRELAERICALLNDSEERASIWPKERIDPGAFQRDRLGTWPAADSCTCPQHIPHADPTCPVHQGRKARGPKPPPVGPGCICDGSGRTCPRHGVVL